MPHESLVLSLKIFDNIESWAASRHDAFALRVLLGHLIEIALVGDIYEVFKTYDAAQLYEEMCGRGVRFDRRVRMIDAVLRLFQNTPILSQRFPHRKKEWMMLKELVDAEERERFIKGKYAFQWLNAATGLLQETAAEFDEGMAQLHKLGFSTAEKKRIISDVLWEINTMKSYAPQKAEKPAVIWTKHLKMLELFDPDDATEDDEDSDQEAAGVRNAEKDDEPVAEGINATQVPTVATREQCVS